MTSVLTVEFVGEEIVRFILFTLQMYDLLHEMSISASLVPRGLYESYVVFDHTNVTTTNIY